MEILDEKNIDCISPYFQSGCRFVKLLVSCHLTPNYKNENLVPNNKTWSLIKLQKYQCLIIKIWFLIIKAWFPITIKKLVPNNQNSVLSNKNYVPNHRYYVPFKTSEPNNKKKTSGP